MDTKNFMPGEEVVAGIRKDIEAYEAERVKAHAQVRWRVPVFLAILLLVMVVLAYALNSFANAYEQWVSAPHIFLYFGTFVAAFFVYNTAMAPAARLRQSFRERVLPMVFSFIKNVRYAKGWVPDSFDRLPRQAVGTFNRQTFDDVVSGEYDGFPFELYEATLSQKAGKSESVVFKGVITAFETTTPFPGLLVAAKRAGAVSSFFSNLFGSSRELETVQSGVPFIDEAYEFHTDNIGAAQALVAGRLAKALQWLSETWPGEPARVSLKGRDGYLLLPVHKNFFELPSISEPIDYKTHIEPIVADLVSLLATAALVRKVGQADDQPAEESQPGDTNS